ncbi:hypothetical protein B9Z19DRAFT_983671 [Tuber borchii]|uniref:Fatty acid hydroxylase domain-containing protein n=1 Tax=Tuber borchii TaxID=42251 RepID=A0A2T6ZSA4_TUBBO|nr:hypothetical protein B9Z19DRAFT_983671 [Tuber borchii]
MLDLLLSISGLTLLFTSSLTSWSTSLNLLFFYIAWSTLLLAHSPLRIELFGTLITRFIFFWLPALFFYLLDTALPSITSQWKIRAGTSAQFDRRAGKVVAVAMGNMLLGVGVQGLVEWALIEVAGWKSAVRVSSGMPLPGGVVWDLIRGLVLREVLQYYLHRFYLHSTSSLHTRWQHAPPTPSPLWPALAHYDHPLPYLIHRFVPVYLPAAFFRFHALTYFAFIAAVSLEEAFTHSGYGKLFFSSLLSGAGRRTAAHFASKGKGNYSTWGVLDWLHGTMVGGGRSEKKGRKRDDK